MPKTGYQSVTVSESDLEQMEKIGQQLNCRTRPETLRQMIRIVKNAINAVCESLSHNQSNLLRYFK